MAKSCVNVSSEISNHLLKFQRVLQPSGVEVLENQSCSTALVQCAPGQGARCIPRKYAHFILNLPLLFKGSLSGEQLIPNQAINSVCWIQTFLSFAGSGVGKGGLARVGVGCSHRSLLCCSRSLSNPRKDEIWQTALVHSGIWSVRQRPKTV